MSEQLLFWTGNQNPSITETILNDNGTAHDLTGQTVKFKMRAPGAATMKVNAAAVVVSAPAGTVRYDWQTADVDTAGQYLCWWEVTTTAGGKTQDMAEAIIEFRAHSNANIYVELEQLKSSGELTGTSFSDQDLRMAIGAATTAINNECERRFWADADATSVRTYTPDSDMDLRIDDLVTLTTVKIDRSGDGTFEETWTNNTDFVLAPFNAPNEIPARPYERITIRSNSGRYFPCGIEKSVEVTGKFGWPAVPDEIKVATTILAARYVKRMRESPLGVAAIGLDGSVMRVSITDPDIAGIVGDLTRRTPFI